jgi:hypothetical protein
MVTSHSVHTPSHRWRRYTKAARAATLCSSHDCFAFTNHQASGGQPVTTNRAYMINAMMDT